MPITCKSCQREIIFAITKNGRRMPLDPQPAAEGNILITHGLDASGKPALYAEQVDRATQAAGKALHVSHFSTCNDPKRFRRSGPKGGVHVP